MVKEKVLLVEDEDGVRGLIELYLRNHGYEVDGVDSGEKALRQMDESVDLILLDIEMPSLNGFEVCRRIREKYTIPIIFISSRRDVLDKVKSFELGGDDYLTKPFDFVELEARIRANIRRYAAIEKRVPSNKLIFPDIEICLDSFQCIIAGKKVPLSSKEMEILIALAKHPNQVWSAEQLYDYIWGFNALGDVGTIKVHISNLRRKIASNLKESQYIHTVRGFGYKFSDSF